MWITVEIITIDRLKLNCKNNHISSRKTEHRFFKSTMEGRRNSSSVVEESRL